MKLIKNIESGEYVIKYGAASLARFYSKYIIKSKIPLFGGVLIFYDGINKPKYRNLFWYSILPYLYAPICIVVLIFISLICLTGVMIYTISKLLLTISHLLMFKFNSAKHELNDVLEFWGIKK